MVIRALIAVVDRITAVPTTVNPAPLHRSLSSQQNLQNSTLTPKALPDSHLLSLHVVSTPASEVAQPLLEYSIPNDVPHSFCVNSEEERESVINWQIYKLYITPRIGIMFVVQIRLLNEFTITSRDRTAFYVTARKWRV